MVGNTSATEAALRLLARQIRLARKQRRFSERALAERVGIARLDDKLALLPKSVRPARPADDVDDF